MVRIIRRVVLLFAAILPAGGCGWMERPYARDPVLRYGYGVWGDHGRARNPDWHPIAEPVPPSPPMPTDLPNLEWEK